MAIGIHPRDLADRLAPNGEALAQDEIRAAERLTEFGAALFTRYLGASAYAALPATVANNALLRLAGWFRDAPAVSSRAVANSRGQGREANQRPVEYGFEWSIDHAQATAHPLRQSGAMSLLSPYKRRRAL